MKHLSTRSAILAFLAGGLFFLNSCLSDTNSSQSSVFQVGLEIDDMGTFLKTDSESDSIRIDQVRIIFGNLYTKTSEDSLSFNGQPAQAGLDFGESNYANPRNLTGRGVPGGVYSNFTLNIVQAPESGGSGFSDFVDSDGTRYSIIVNGSYNDTDFQYESEQTISRTFNFGPLNIAEENDSYVYLITMDASGWFLGPDGYIDPDDDDNSSQIDSNINASLGFEEYDPSTQQ